MPNIDALMKKYSGDEAVTTTTTSSIEQKSKVDIEGLAKKYGMEEISEPKKEKEKSWLASGNVDLSEYTPPALNNFEQGLIRGVTDVLATGGRGVAYLDKLLLPGGEKRHKAYNEAIETAKNEYEKEYGESTVANVGRIVGQAGITAPIIGATLPTTGIAAGLGALPTVAATGAKIAAPLSRRLVSSAVSGALGGAEFGGLTQAATDESLPESVGKGAITGAIGGPLLTGAAAGAKGLGRFVAGKLSSETAALAERAKQLGIRLTAPQISENQFFKTVEQKSGYLPFSGSAALKSEQQASINQAVSRTFGENTSQLSPKLIENSLKKIGNEMNVAAQNTTIDTSNVNTLKNDFIRILNDADKVVVEDELRPIFKQALNVLSKADADGNISGEAYKSLTAYNGILSKAQKSSNPNIKMFANEIRNSLDDALERSAAPADRQALINARRKYKAAKTVEDLIESDPQGDISPLKLLSAVKKAPGGKSGAGILGEIADIGQKFFRLPPESGTPLGHFVMQNLPTGVAGWSAIGAGHILGGIAAGGKIATGLAANRLMRAGITSRSAANALVKLGQGHTSGKLDKLTTGATPYLAPQVGKITVKPYLEESKEKKMSLPATLR